MTQEICDLIQWSPERLKGYIDTLNNSPDRSMVVNLPEDVYSDYNETNAKFRYSLGVREAKHYLNTRSCKIDKWSPSSEELMNIAESWSSIAASTEEGNFDASEAVWSFNKEYPTSGFLTLMTREEWKDWFRNECKWASEDGRTGYGDLFLQEIMEPVVIVETGDNKNDIWDGWHRAGASIAKKADHIPSIIGIPDLTLKMKL